MNSSNTNTVWYGTGSAFTTLPQSFTNVQDVVVTPEHIVVTDLSTVSVFGTSGNFIKSYDVLELVNSGTYVDSKIYAATKVSGGVTAYTKLSLITASREASYNPPLVKNAESSNSFRSNRKIDTPYPTEITARFPVIEI